MQTRTATLIPVLVLALFPACSGKTTDGASQPSENGGAGESGGAAGSSAGTAGSGAFGGHGDGGFGGIGGTPEGGSGGATGGTGGGTGGASNRPPANHRATATACDHTRPTNDPGAPPLEDGGVYGGYIECRTHAECTAGDNGRCVGNGHDGWHCTYDACFTDSDCPAPAGPASGPVVCACENGFRSDNNTCIQGNCQVDADCDAKGLHWCSPTLGSCGNYTGFQGYYCHTPSDECLDDADCSANGGYCAYEPTVGHWACSTQQCVG